MIRFLSYLLLTTLFFSCKGDDNDVNDSLITIKGHVDLFSELLTFNRLPSSEGVIVTLLAADGSVLSNYITNDDGLFDFEIQNDGPFVMTFEKPMFSYYQTKEFEVEEKSKFFNVDLSEKSTIEILDFDIQVIDPEENVASYGNFTLKTTPLFTLGSEEFYKRHFRIFIHDSADISPENYTYSVIYSPFKDHSDLLEQTEDYTLLKSINNHWMVSGPSGTRLYYQVFGSTEHQIGYYNDHFDKYIYTSISEKGSEIVELIIP